MKAIVLGAGKGKRLLSEQHDMPKVMRMANGKPLLQYVLDRLNFIEQKDTAIVVGYKKEAVLENIQGEYQFAVQDEQLGTGHAVRMAESCFAGCSDDVLVCYGDMPLVTQKTYQGIVEEHKKSGADCTVLTAISDASLAYGRVIRDENGNFMEVVEQKDCTEEQKKIKELNVGIYVFKCDLLFSYLKQLKNSNAQGEYYLTDVPKLMLEEGRKISIFSISGDTEIFGVNTPEDLEFCEQALRNQAE